MQQDGARFAAALSAVRQCVPDLSIEALARRASTLGRTAVNPRRLGEWLTGRSVPRHFDAVHAVVLAVDAARPGASPVSVARLRRLWQAAAGQRTEQTTPDLVVGRPPTDAPALIRRAALADAVDRALREPAVEQVLLTGAGGVGKSQLACAAFHDAQGAREVRVWVPAADRAAVVATYARAWRAISVPAAAADRPGAAPDEDAQADRFVAWLRTTGRPWLVVLDDLDDPAALDGLWPAGPHGRTIITSRRRDAAVIRPAVRIVPVGGFSPQEAMAYLSNRISLDPHAGIPPSLDEDLAGLAAAVDHFPLALSQAAAYLIDTGTTVTAYRRLLDDRRTPLSEVLPATSPADGRRTTVAGTWQLSAERAAALAPDGAATRMLELVAFLDPDGVPESVLTSAAAQRWVAAGAAMAAIRAAHRLNLLTHDRSREPVSIGMHAVVQRAVRDTVPPARRVELVAAAANALAEVWSAHTADPVTLAVLHRNLEALLAATGAELCAGGLHPLLRTAARWLILSGRTDAAIDLVADLLDRIGPDRPRDALILRHLHARAVGEAGDVAAAKDQLQQLLEGRDQADPETLGVRVDLAHFRMESGQIAAARAELTGLVRDTTTAFGADHDLTLETRLFAALCLGFGGDPAGARDEYANFVDDLTRLRGADDLLRVTALTYWARWTCEAGDPAAAVARFSDAVQRLDRLVGRAHVSSLTARHNLAFTCGLAGDIDAALAEFAELTADAVRAIGPDHQFTLVCRANGAYWHGRAGQIDAAIAELDRLQPDLALVFGSPDHPTCLRIRQRAAELYALAGRHDAAAGRARPLLATLIQVLGPDHVRVQEVGALLRGR